MNPEELDRLIHRYFEKDLSAEEEALLAALIRTDRTVADRFVELSELESALVESLHAEEAAPPEVATPMRNSRRRTKVLQAPVARPVWPLFFAAALLLGFLAILLNSAKQPVAPSVAIQNPSVIVENRAPEQAPVVNPGPSPRPVSPKPVDDFVPTPFVPKPSNDPKPLPSATQESKPEEKREPAPNDRPATQVESAVVAEATIEKVEGEVVRIAASAAPVAAAQTLPSGQGLEVRKGMALLKLADGTRVELRPNTRLDRMLLTEEYKRFEVSRGSASSSVMKQSPKSPVMFLTPQAEMTVVGTRLSFEIAANDTTRLDVQEGRVKMKWDKHTVEVTAGRYAIAGKGQPPVTKPATIVRAFQDGLFPTPDYAGTQDTWISSKEPTKNFATGQYLRLEKLEQSLTTLISWDVKSIPAGSRILSAELSFWVTGKIVGNCKVYELRMPFSESEATWRLALSNRPWRIQGAQSDADRGTQVIGLLAPPGPVAIYTMPLNEWGVLALQETVNTGKLPFGVVILGPDANEWNLDSRESATPERRPKLTVTYLPK
ncbi:MAG TPA: DNRLRE domain-containing protein [Planctomycetota bacterium]|jgi:ferric-dicitrate binding protein FerR (iron transport regulator)|nr:DNRLRE domain-containing protein [Planctomycetota bacterium]